MADISLTNSTIYAQNINNFTGELFKVGGQRTPLLSAVGGLNGGKTLNSTFWQVVNLSLCRETMQLKCAPMTRGLVNSGRIMPDSLTLDLVWRNWGPARLAPCLRCARMMCRS